MEWRFNPMLSVHELASNGTVLARIYVSEKPRNRLPFRAKSLVSALYYSSRTMARLDRKKKEWVSGARKFRTREALDEYLKRKKAEIERFIQARERESAT
ncbi:MAG: hypothetical protein HY720_18705 [Planctomycetes bacterium]|nr:hypothetical protein [Planctomycetota bacterium]